MSATNRTLSRRWFEEVWNERRTEAIDELLSPDGIGHMESGEVVGTGPFKAVRDQFLATFPDLRFEIEGVVSDGDDVVVRWRATGTHTGDGLGLEPTHQPIDVRGMTWHRFRDGVMVEGWDCWNQEGLLRRLRKGEGEGEGEGPGAAHGPAGAAHAPSVKVKLREELSARLREVRKEIFGDHGGPELARRLGLPARTWYGYETGITVPAEVLLDFIEHTGVNPHWLHTGEGPKYRRNDDAPPLVELLRRALRELEQKEATDAGGGAGPPVGRPRRASRRDRPAAPSD